MPSPHTAEHMRQLVDEVLDEWKLSYNKVSAIITDSGSNMVVAFHRQVEKGVEESDMDKSEEEEEEEEEDGDQAQIEVEDF